MGKGRNLHLTTYVHLGLLFYSGFFVAVYLVDKREFISDMDSDSDDNLIDEDEIGHTLPNHFNLTFNRRPNNIRKDGRTKYRNDMYMN